MTDIEKFSAEVARISAVFDEKDAHIEALEAEVSNLRVCLDAVRSGIHLSDCGVHNAPAEEVGAL